jgi:hypothetical protein
LDSTLAIMHKDKIFVIYLSLGSGSNLTWVELDTYYRGMSRFSTTYLGVGGVWGMSTGASWNNRKDTFKFGKHRFQCTGVGLVRRA